MNPDATTTRRLLRRFPNAELIAADLLRLPLPTPTLPPATTTNHYLVGERDLLLVDPATPNAAARAQLLDLLDGLKRLGRRLTGLLLTHHHRDHMGAAAFLADQLKVPILAHAITARLLDGELKVDRLVAEGDVLLADGPGWRVLHTPGHASGHVILHRAQGGMIVGDMVAGEGTILVEPGDGSMADYLASLERMRALSPTFLAPAHGPVLTDALGTLDHYLRHRRAREALIFAALSPQWQRDDALLPAAYSDVSRLIWPMALRSLRAHLIHLEEQQLAERQGPRWRRIQGARWRSSQ